MGARVKLVVLAAVVGGVLLVCCAGALAAWGTGVDATLPANAGPNQPVTLGSLSCASAGNCTAVGRYHDSSDNLQGLLLTETAGAWAAGVEATLPANAGPNPVVSLHSVSCASAGNCTAVGNYEESSGNVQGLLLSETAGAWATGVEATLPANAGSPTDAGLASVSCASAGNCAAVGVYTDSSGNRQGLLLSETAGAWARGVQATLPASAGSNPTVVLNSVSCASAGNCTAVGRYLDSSGNTQGLLLSETAGAWATGVEASLPANAANGNSSQAVTLNSVSCASAGNCAAVGVYNDNSPTTQGLLLSETAGAWARGIEATLPANANSEGVNLDSVSCASAGNCTAVGNYHDSSANSQGLLLSETAGLWATGVEASPPRTPDRSRTYSSTRCRARRRATAPPSAATATARITIRGCC